VILSGIPNYRFEVQWLKMSTLRVPRRSLAHFSLPDSQTEAH